MMRTGPESLLVQSSLDARIDLAVFARTEFYAEDPRVLERAVRSDLEYAAGRPGVWDRARAWVRRGRTLPRPAGPAGASERPREMSAATADGGLVGRTLAAMPASLAPLRPQR